MHGRPRVRGRPSTLSNGQNCRAPRTVKRTGCPRRTWPLLGGLPARPSAQLRRPGRRPAAHTLSADDQPGARPAGRPQPAGGARDGGLQHRPGADAAGDGAADRAPGRPSTGSGHGSADLRSDIVGAALSDYTSTGGLSTSASFLVSKTPGQFLNSLATTAVVEHQQASLLTQLRQQQNQLGVQAQQGERELGAIRADQARLAQHKVAARRQRSRRRARLLGRLEGEGSAFGCSRFSAVRR